MPWGSFSGSLSTSNVDVVIDMGNPFLNRTVDGFIKIGAVGASRVAAEETYHFLQKGNVSKSKLQDAYSQNLEHSSLLEQTTSSLVLGFQLIKKLILKKMCKEGAYWGTVAGVYVGMEYGVERIRGTRDWKNAMLGGAITGALISAASKKSGDQIIKDAIRGGAVATAAEILNYIT